MATMLGPLRQALTAGKSIVRFYPLAAISAATLFGVIIWGGFNWSLELTNTERFCISCHVMREHIYKEYEKTVHYENRTGVRATCPDCHVPKDWIHKVIRKVRATNELYHWLRGSIDTPEKFRAKRAQLAQSVWAVMKANDSRECRNCHEMRHMASQAQKPVAAKMHQLAAKWKMTCIDCHKGIMHEIPEAYNKVAFMDKLHKRFKVEKVNCRECHKDMAGPPPGDRW